MRPRPGVLWLPPLLTAGLLVTLVGTGYDHTPLWPTGDALPGSVAIPRASADPPATGEAEQRYRRVEDALHRLRPRGNYIVVDQTHNRLRLLRKGRVLLEAPCSAGSGMVLREGPRGRRWVFDTPRGRFQVLSKLRDPVWRKPDWAFVEEGKPVPSDPSVRFEYGVLGEYALYFGDGYMIHGTLYERLLGRSVTHGCVRLGREPLRKLYHASTVGTPIFIF
jgi:L,D-transpeptidase ErfK/SrfK